MHPVPAFRVVSEPVQSRFRVVLFFAVAMAAGAPGCGRGSTDQPLPPVTNPDIVLITIDTLRADRVGRGIMPALDALAARGVQFTQARATAPLTLPSHVTILTGTLPPAHGVRENGTHIFTGTPRSIARDLKDAGYQTAAFVGAYVLDRRFGLSDGFDHYDDQIARDPDAPLRLEAERPANEVVDRALAWLAPSPPNTPTFMWVHLYDPHSPHRATYDDDVRFADGEMGRLLKKVREGGREPVVLVVGDHGESLGEHGERTHGMLLYEAAVRVPFVIAGPGIASARRDEPVSLADVAPTLLALTRRTSADAAGRNLLEASRVDREIYSESEYPRVAGWSPVYSLLQDRWKLIVSREPELYDLATDPAESKNLAAERQPLVNAMGSRLEAMRSTSRRARMATPPDAAERLRALGYVAGSSEPPKPGDGPNPANHIAAWGQFEDALTSLASGTPSSALGGLKELAAKYPDAPVFQSTYARTLAQTGSTSAALDVYRRAVARWPNDATLFHELAVAAYDAGRAEEAMKAERAALALAPNLAAAHNGAGLLMVDAGRNEEAIAAFESAVAGDPTNAEYWVNLGNARRAAQNTNGAADAYRRAIEIDPRSPDGANGLGVLLVQQRQAADAIPWFERALKASPQFVEARLNLGIAYQESGQPDRAREAYREVLARAPRAAPERRAAADLLRSLER